MRTVAIVAAVVAVAAGVAARLAPVGVPRIATVDPRVLADTANGRSARFLVRMRRQANLTAALAGARGAAMGARAVATLQAAAAGQNGVEVELRNLHAPYRSFWV